ncbi:LysR substrate-binding domain-containing protein [Leifsonia kafniensis]|uniref:LysR substrate-binding domain-containing protein n=1 Tax=Leifsonia kafniensis TaxID=475957 RepID=A0ABP7KSU4_9MICO
MDMRQIRYFSVVVGSGSISKAARQLGMTQPPLSASIAQLEKEAGVRLLERTAQGVEPTPAGIYLAAAGDRMLREFAQITADLQSIGQGLLGQLNLAAVLPFSWAYLPPLLHSFSEIAPRVDVNLNDPAPDVVLDGLINGTLDIGIMATSDSDRLQTMYSAQLHVSRISEMPLAAILPPRFASLPGPIDLRDLAGERWMLPSQTPRFLGLPDLVQELWFENGMTPPTLKLIPNLQTALPLIAADMGVSVMPEAVAEMAQTVVITRRIRQRVPPLQIAMVWSKTRQPTEVTERFLATAIAGTPSALGSL